MKKNVIYISSALVIGLLIGYLIFNNNLAEPKASENEHAKHTTESEMWTCSMHPQIMQPEPGDCPICGMELIPAEAHAEALSPNEITMTPTAMALANIQTTIVNSTKSSDNNTIELSGKIASNEKADAVQASYFEGRIEKLYVNSTGETVSKGQLLATIYAPSLVNAQQELITTASMKSSQPELYQAVRNKLKLWKLSEQQINQIESSGKVREVFPIYATVSGTILDKMAEEGDYVSKGQPIFRLSNLYSLWAVFDAYENQIASLNVGDPITVSTNAYPEKEYQAKISFIDPILDVDSRTVAVRATLSNANNLLKPGMFAIGKIKLEKSSSKSNLTIPATAVMWTGERSLVYVKTKPNDPVFEMREVTIGERSSGMYTITNGLTSGEEVVVNGTFTVDAAAQLQGKRSMMTHTSDNTHAEDVHSNRITVSPKFQTELAKLFEEYIVLKDALVNDDAKESQSMANKLKVTVKEISGNQLNDDNAKAKWKDIQHELESSIRKIAETKDITKQRKSFIKFSNQMKIAIHNFGINQTVYSLYCPMANSDKGAYWLSKDQKVLNPYFGEAMLSCGEVREEIK